MTGPAAATPFTTSPGAAGQMPEVCYEVRWPDGRRFDARRKLSKYQVDLLVEGGVCEEVRSPTGILRYVKLRQIPPLRRFASIAAQANFTIRKTGILNEHAESKRKGL